LDSEKRSKFGAI